MSLDCGELYSALVSHQTPPLPAQHFEAGSSLYWSLSLHVQCLQTTISAAAKATSRWAAVTLALAGAAVRMIAQWLKALPVVWHSHIRHASALTLRTDALFAPLP